jgi:hypothetical protein
MGQISRTPASWRYLAAIHAVDLEELPRRSWAKGATWNECQHNSWFFLPWHRMYLHYFEQIVRQTIADLGGPDDWALPYWDYSDPDRENVRRLPPAFREPQMPSGDPNPLFVSERRPAMNEGGELPEALVDTGEAMAMRFFDRLRIDVDPRPEEIFLATGIGDPELVGITLKEGPACSRFRPTGASTWLSEAVSRRAG